MAHRNKQSFLHGALILSVAAILTKIIGALFFKIPLQNISDMAYGFFNPVFDIYIPLYTVSTAGFPIAVSRMVSESLTLKRYRDIRVIHRVAKRVFLVTGSVGTGIMVIASFIYPGAIKAPDTQITMLVMAPSILFCCMISAYRGVYEGSRNMYPTAISQIVEVIGKLLIGLGLAAGALHYGQWRFSQGKPVFGKMAETAEQALSFTQPYIAAGAMVGVTVGSLFSLLYLMLRYRMKGNGLTREELSQAPRPHSSRRMFKSLLRLAIPVALGTLATQLTTLIDVFSLQTSLATVAEKSGDLIRELYAFRIPEGGTQEIVVYLSAQRGIAMTWVNLVPNITLSLGISALPVVTSAWALKDRRQLKKTISLVLRITSLVALPSGIGLAVLARPIMNMIYGSVRAEVAANQLQVLGIAVVFICLVAPINAMLQAIGRADIPVKIVLVGGAIKLFLNITLIMNPRINIMGSAYSTLACYVVMVVLSLISLYKVLDMRLKWRSIFLKPFIASILCTLAAYEADSLIGMVIKSRFVTIFSIILAVVIYVWILLLIGAVKRDDILMLPKGQKIVQILEKRDWIE